MSKIRMFRAACAVAMLAVAGGVSAKDSVTLMTKSGPLPAVAPGKAQVIFFRPGSIVGMAIGCTVHEGEQQIARLGSGKYWVVTADLGKHEYRTEGERTDRLNLELESGERYFVKCNIGAGVMAGRANLSPTDEAGFAAKAKGLKLWEPKADK